MKTICVTGGAGFIGSHLTPALIADGHRVMILDDLSAGRRENVPDGAELHVLDVRSPEAARVVAESGVDVLVHLAAQIDLRHSVEAPVEDADVNILGSLNILEAARRGGVRQVIFASTGGAVYGEQECYPAPEEHPLRPISPYGVAKLAVERYLYCYHVNDGLDVTCLRFANVYGERQNPGGEAGVVAIFIGRVLAGEAPTIHGDGSQTRDYVHASDVVKTITAVLGRPGFLVFNVGTGVETSVTDVYHKIAAAAGSDLAPVHGPEKAGELSRSSVDFSRARRELGVPEPLTLAEGLARIVPWYRQQRQTVGERC